MATALLIIDVQQVLCTGRWAAYEADRVIDRINDVSRRAREAGVFVVVIQHQTDITGGMSPFSDAWKLSPRLETDRSDTFLSKMAPDSFHRTRLDSMLRARGVTDLVVCGMQSDFCVDTTTRRALALGYPVVLVADGHSTIDNDVLTAPQIIAHHETTLANLDSFGPRVRPMPAADIVFGPGSRARGSMPGFEESDRLDRAYLAVQPGEQSSLLASYEYLLGRWQAGIRDRETALRLLFLVWFSYAEPLFLTELPGAVPSSLFGEISDSLGLETTEDAELLFVAKVMIEVCDWGYTSEEGVRASVDRIRQRVEARSFDVSPEVFENRGAFGDYFAHQAEGHARAKATRAKAKSVGRTTENLVWIPSPGSLPH